VSDIYVDYNDYIKAYKDHPGITVKVKENAIDMLVKVNALLTECVENGWEYRVNPVTGTLVSGQDNGGWRPPECPIGAATSSHKEGRGIDIADGNGRLDAMITDAMLERHGLYREHPDATSGWCHLTTRAPKSKRRTFWP
jgi:hypothetical protein